MVEAGGIHFHRSGGLMRKFWVIFRPLPHSRSAFDVKRWPIVLLLSLAVIVFLSPGIVGRLAEKNLDENLSWLEAENDDLVVTSLQFDRGWFTSEGRHRVTLKDGSLFDSLGRVEGYDRGGAASLIIETHLDHGLLPLASLSRKEGSLKPGLGSSVSTMKLDHGDGSLTDLPGTLYSRIGLTGNSSFHFVMDAGSQNEPGSEISWSGADITVLTNPASRSLRISGDIQPTTMASYDVTTQVGSVSFELHQDRSQYSYGIGELSLVIESVTVSRPGEPLAGFGEIVLDVESKLDGDRVNGRSTVSLTRVLAPGTGPVNVDIDFAANGIDARLLETLIGTLQGAQTSSSGLSLLSGIPPQALPEAQNILDRGMGIRFERLDISLPQGDLSVTLSVDIPESGAGNPFSWPRLLLATTAAVDLSMSVSLFELVQAANPDATMLLALGMLKRNGDSYEMAARYEKGLMTINGAPMAIPLSLPQ